MRDLRVEKWCLRHRTVIDSAHQAVNVIESLKGMYPLSSWYALAARDAENVSAYDADRRIMACQLTEERIRAMIYSNGLMGLVNSESLEEALCAGHERISRRYGAVYSSDAVIVVPDIRVAVRREELPACGQSMVLFNRDGDPIYSLTEQH